MSLGNFLNLSIRTDNIILQIQKHDGVRPSCVQNILRKLPLNQVPSQCLEKCYT